MMWARTICWVFPDTDQMSQAGEHINDYFDNLGDKYGFVHFSDLNHTIPGTGGLP